MNADAAAGLVDVNAYPISRRLEGFSDIVTGHVATPMLNGQITLVGSADREGPHTSSHPLTGTVAGMQDIYAEPSCPSPVGVNLRDMIRLAMNGLVLPGMSGSLVIDGNGAIVGMLNAASYSPEGNPTQLAWAAKERHIKAALNFEQWVGSETVMVEGQVVNPEKTSTIRGWVYDPLNPGATLKVEMYAGGEKGTGKKVVPTLMANLSQEDADIEDLSGAGPAREPHGSRVGRIPPQYSRSPFYVYALQPDSDPEKWELLDGSGVRPWPTTSESIDPRPQTDEHGNRQTAIRVKNDVDGDYDSNFPVDPNAKATVEAVLAAVHGSKTPPAITSININSTVRAKSLKRERRGERQSPHVCGRAVDINRINGCPVRCAHPDFSAADRCRKVKDISLDCKDALSLPKDPRPTEEEVYQKMYQETTKWVTALQDAFLKDSRVEEVFGPEVNRDKATRWVSPKIEKDHRNHIHITVWETGQSTCTE